MMSLPIGFLGMLVVIYLSIGHGGSWSLYLNAHSMIIVCGGTAMILLFTTPVEGLKNLFRALRELMAPAHSMQSLQRELAQFAQEKDNESIVAHHPLLSYASELWRQGISSDLFIPLVSQKRTDLDDDLLDAIQTLKNLAKYPPALGMTGTVIGLVSLFSQLGADAKSTLGPALALAMTATFFGLIMANAVIVPLADRLQVMHIQKRRLNARVFKLVLMINRDEPRTIIEEELTRDAAA